MLLAQGQGGLLEESVGFVIADPGATTGTPSIVVNQSRPDIVKALWRHWILCPYFADSWVPSSNWPKEVLDTADQHKSKTGVSYSLDANAQRAWAPKLAV